MKILVSGAKGFIGRNLIAGLQNHGYGEIYGYDKDTGPDLLDRYLEEAEFVFHLAGANRPVDDTEYRKDNADFTQLLLDSLRKYNNNCPVVYSSSTQALLDNPYGRSKKSGEDAVFKYAGETGARVMVYRFPNVFGKWCRPNYNSAVATFCHNIANDLPIRVNSPEAVLQLVYIDDVAEELLRAVKGEENRNGAFCSVPVVHTATVGWLADTVRAFKSSREELSIPDMSDALTKKLYSTYLSYLPEGDLSYGLKTNTDRRGSFTEFIKQAQLGQLSVNIAKPGIVKGNHWHHSKVEKFLVVSGQGVIRLRRIDSEEIISYFVEGGKPQVVDIPPGYTHNIENTGTAELVTVIWANEGFDKNNPDTYPMEV